METWSALAAIIRYREASQEAAAAATPEAAAAATPAATVEVDDAGVWNTAKVRPDTIGSDALTPTAKSRGGEAASETASESASETASEGFDEETAQRVQRLRALAASYEEAIQLRRVMGASQRVPQARQFPGNMPPPARGAEPAAPSAPRSLTHARNSSTERNRQCIGLGFDAGEEGSEGLFDVNGTELLQSGLGLLMAITGRPDARALCTVGRPGV
jgi:hypothetical protein